MEATTSRPRFLLNNLLALKPLTLGLSLIEALAIGLVARRSGLWPLAAAMVVLIEGWPLWGRIRSVSKERLYERLPGLLVGLSVVVIIATVPRLATQIVTVLAFLAWRVWWAGTEQITSHGLVNLLLIQAAMFEAIFLAAAVWRPAHWIILAVAWLGSYASVYGALARRSERAAGVLAAAWASIVVEIGWVLLLWLCVYTVGSGYILVPQPALILTALAYCFGSIYLAQRSGSLSRGRLTEYVLIGLVLVAIVVTGTSWRGTL